MSEQRLPYLKPRKQSFHGLKVGDYVCVHGEGFGNIVAMGEGDCPSDDRVVVEVERQERHESGLVLTWTKTFTRHPMHISKGRH